MLACARVGAVHSVIFGGFSARAIRDRAGDAETRVIVTADGGYRRGTVLPLKKIVDEAVAGLDVVQHVVVFKRAGIEVSMREGRERLHVGRRAGLAGARSVLADGRGI